LSNEFNTENKQIPAIKWILPFVALFLVIVLDQWLKYWIKNTMILHTERKIFGDWFILHFTENEGMAFGMKFFDVYGKYALTILRIGVSIFGFWYLITHIRKHASTFFLVCVALILGGAIGNIIDCVFYGVVYHDMNQYEGGYLLGWVVDMLYFPMLEFKLPDGLPFLGGNTISFFDPVFNIADAAISTGVITLLVFQKKMIHAKDQIEKGVEKSPVETPSQNV
jgi:signal peptidase II